MSKHNTKAKNRLSRRVASFEKTRADPGRGLTYHRPGSLK